MGSVRRLPCVSRANVPCVQGDVSGDVWSTRVKGRGSLHTPHAGGRMLTDAVLVHEPQERLEAPSLPPGHERDLWGDGGAGALWAGGSGPFSDQVDLHVYLPRALRSPQG